MAMAFKGFGRPTFENASDQSGFGLPQLSADVVAAGQPAPSSGGFFSEGGAGRNIAGYLGDYLAQLGGARPIYAPVMKQRQAIQQADQQRRHAFQDWTAKQEWERANPGPSKIEQDVTAWQRLSDEQKAAYQEMHPEYRQGPDGQFYRINIGGNMPAPSGGTLPTFSQDDWDKAGGSAGNGTGGFR